MSLLAVAISFAGGFLLANALNRSEMDSLRAESERAKNALVGNNATAGSEPELTTTEIRAKIAEADANPDKIEFQRNLGLALYRYGAMRKDAELIGESARLLERALAANENDRQVQVSLGHAYFDIGYFNNDNEMLIRSRTVYEKALEADPDDADTRCDLALTYFLQQPPDHNAAAREFERTLKTNPKHERAFDFYIQTLVALNRIDDAEAQLEILKTVNPSNESIAGLTGRIREAKAR